MNKALSVIPAVVLSILFLSLCSAQAQETLELHIPKVTCDGPVFSGKAITQRAKIISRKFPTLTPEALTHDVHGEVVLEAVLCRTGRVTDVRVIKGLEYGMTAAAVAALFSIQFKPAEMNWHTVSERMQFEFVFGDGLSGIDEISLDRAAGRLIERLEVSGNRRFEEEQILHWTSTRAGDLFSAAQLQRDLDTILKTGYFNKRKSRLYVEEGKNGKVVVYFSVVELPLIAEVRVEGLKDVNETSILEALLSENLGLGAQASLPACLLLIEAGKDACANVADPEKIRNAISIINKILQLKGHRAATVDVRYEVMSSQVVKLAFVVSGID